ncbi:hypothetical protein QUB68_14780 [Microcoleus sp. A006_D1]|uniref:hypothetical protein n=1 Tax=Microcoleus sp. A006_D1 TaxID=3055267 RepID=UPI002FD3555A
MNFSATVTICQIIKIKGQKPNLEANSYQQIALLATNNFSSSFAPSLKRARLSRAKKTARNRSQLS